MEGTAPQSVNYANTLPLAVSSTQNRRSYFPQNGQTFTSNSNNIIRIDVNADGLLDCQQSYLEFSLADLGGSGVRTLDQGHVWIKRLTIESAGVVLEDINNYNRLISGILQPAQGSAAYMGEVQLSMLGGSGNVNSDGAPDAFGETNFQNKLASVIFDAAGTPTANEPQDRKNATGVLAQGGTFTGQYHLVSGLLNMDKYIPLFLMGQGFTIQLELATGAEIGVTTAASTANYSISNVRYVAHVVDMERDFYDMIRNIQMESGGSLMIGSSTFRHFSHAYDPAGVENVNISARVRSLENILFVGNQTANLTNKQVYGLSTGVTLGMDGGGSFNVFIGSVRYPSNTIAVNPISNKGQAYQELRKCFGSLGSINHGGLLTAGTYLTSPTGTTVTGASAEHGNNPCYAPLGISFKSWRHELEDGIDTSSRALPIRLELTAGPTDAATNVATTLDIYCQATVLFYFNLDGSVSSSV